MQSTIAQITLSMLLASCAIAGETSPTVLPPEVSSAIERFTKKTHCRLHTKFRIEPVKENPNAVRVFENLVFVDKSMVVTEPNLVSSFRAAKTVYACVEHRVLHTLAPATAIDSLVLIDGDGNLIDILSRRPDYYFEKSEGKKAPAAPQP